jgi:hypothetical protein
VSQEALEVLVQYPPQERGSVISQAIVEWEGNVTSDASHNVTDNIQPALEEVKHRLEVLEKRVMGERTENIPKSVTGDVMNNVTDNFAPLRSLASTPEYKAALVKEAHRLQAEGLSFEAIAQVWNTERIPTLSEKGRWHRKSLSRLI